MSEIAKGVGVGGIRALMGPHGASVFMGEMDEET